MAHNKRISAFILDVRKDCTKLDGILWTATLSENRADFDALAAPVCRWMSETPDRLPLTDWYDTRTGNRSVSRRVPWSEAFSCPC